jgi:hypothetical protein
VVDHDSVDILFSSLMRSVLSLFPLLVFPLSTSSLPSYAQLCLPTTDIIRHSRLKMCTGSCMLYDGHSLVLLCSVDIRICCFSFVALVALVGRALFLLCFALQLAVYRPLLSGFLFILVHIESESVFL